MLGLGNSIIGTPWLESGFTPASLGNLDVHYDFSLLTGSDGDGISSFVNAGEAGSDYDLAQSTGSNQPTLDTSSMAANSAAFDNSNDRLDSSNPYVTTGKTFTFFVSFETGQAGADVYMGGDVGDNLNFVQLAGANGVAIQTKFNGDLDGTNNTSVTTKINGTQSTGGDGDINHTYRESVPEVLIITRDASNNIRFFNHTGGLMATSTSDTTDDDTNFRFQRLGVAGNSGSPYDGNIGEIGLYNATLSDAEVLTLATYLKDKWSVS